MVSVNVEGGTRAGHRIVRQLDPWAHLCDAGTVRHPADRDAPVAEVTLPGARYSCPYCGERRPTDG